MSNRWMIFIGIFSQVVGLLAVIIIGVLYGKYQGGFAWGSDLTKVFNNHPLFMTIGMVIFYGDAILVYRVFANVNKLQVKILHAVLLALSLIFASIGLKAVFDSHNKANPPQDNLKSLHSWVGLSAVVLFGCQWVCGFLAFLFPKLNENIRRMYMPSHKFWGKTIFLLAIAAVCMGVIEASIYSKYYSDASLANQRRAMNFFGVFVLIFAGMIFYLVNNPDFQRPADYNTEHIPLNN